MEDRQERYEKLYIKVQSELIKSNIIKKSLMEICSVWLDREGNENQVNIELLLESSMRQKIEVTKSFNKYCKEFGFTINYVNVSGDLPTDWD